MRLHLFHDLPRDLAHARTELEDLDAAARDATARADLDVQVSLAASARLVLAAPAAAEAAAFYGLEVREVPNPPLTWVFSGPAASVARLVRDYVGEVGR